MSYPDDLRYSKEHEWVRVSGTIGTIGITSFAADELGDIVYVELPQVGSRPLSSGVQRAEIQNGCASRQTSDERRLVLEHIRRLLGPWPKSPSPSSRLKGMRPVEPGSPTRVGDHP